MGFKPKKESCLTQLTDLHHICSQVVLDLNCGKSLRKSLFGLIGNMPYGSWSQKISDLLAGQEMDFLKKAESSLTSEVLHCLMYGLQGGSVRQTMALLEEEVVILLEVEQERVIKALPYQALLPILALQLPGFLLMNLTPVLNFVTSYLD